MSPAVGVHVLGELGESIGSRFRAENLRLLKERGLVGLDGELLAERAVYAEGRLAGDERSTRHIPERGRAAVAKNDFIPVGDGEELSKTLANGPDELLDRRLAVGGAEQLGGAGVESLHLLRADFARTGAEPTVPWKHGFGNCYCIAHAC